MEDLIGRTLSHYRIVARIGAGGMGVVYRAEDLHLPREVAIKVLPAGTLADEAARRRFRKEAEALSKLNHPNIQTVHDFDTQEGVDFLVVELVSGPSLSDKLEAGALPEKEITSLGSQIAAALEEAHECGVVHRDLKPGNIKVTPKGQVKVLDFGIAKFLKPFSATASTQSLTETHAVAGTLPYMAPEQLRDEAVDHRSDIWAAGVILYEMATGRRPFEAKLAMALAADIQTKGPPSPGQINPKVSPRVEHIILRCLEKDPDHRYQSARDLLADFRRLTAFTTAPIGPRRQVGAWARRLRWPATAMAAAALVVVALLALNVAGLREGLSGIARKVFAPSPSKPTTRRQLTFSGNAVLPSISPDGKFLAYVVPTVAGTSILVQDLSGGSPDTLGTLPQVHTLEWSPDGTRLLAGSLQRALVLPRQGGAARNVPIPAQFPLVVRAYWLPDGSHVSVHGNSSRRILVIDLQTGDTLWIPVRGSYTWLQEGSWSPAGRVFAVATASTDPARWAILTLARDGRTEVVAEDDSMPLSSPRWSREGNALFYARGSDAIWRVPVSPRTGRRGGAPEVAQQQLDVLHPGDRAHFSLTPDGRRMTYTVDLEFSNLWLLESRGSGSPPLQVQLTRGTAMRWSPRVSPDGRWIGYAEETVGGPDLFRMPLEGGAATQITFGAQVSIDGEIAWSPDGSQMAYVSKRAGRAQIWVATVEGGRLRGLDRTGVGSGGHLTWAPGAWIAFQSEGNRNIHLVDPVSGDRRSLLSDTTVGFVFTPRYSPDGQRLAVRWNRNRPVLDYGIWVFDLRDTSAKKLRAPAMRAPANLPIGWSPDGRYVIAQEGPKIFRLDAQGYRSPSPVMALPFRDEAVHCSPAGPRRPNAFLCSAWVFVSDVWMIENFDISER